MRLVVVSPSRKRPESAAATVALMPVDQVCVAEAEVDAYAAAMRATGVEVPILPHPDAVVGGGWTYRWVLEHVDADCVVFCDDDIKRCVCLVGRRPRIIRTKDAIRQILENSAEICGESGGSLFSYAITANILDFVPMDPLHLSKGGGAVKGVFRKPGCGFFDPELIYHIDADLALTALLKQRFVYKDTRFCFEAHLQANWGGSQDLFGPERYKKDVRYLTRKWGPPTGDVWELRDTDVKGLQGAPIIRAITHVTRKQSLSL